MDWARLIEERDEWVAHNFPDEDRRTDHTILGVVEEMGELTHHHIKRAQGIRMEEAHDEMMRDAVGDMTVYLLGVMRHVGPPEENKSTPVGMEKYATDNPDRIILALSREVGDLCGKHLLYYHRWIGYLGAIVSRIIYLLKMFCYHHRWNYEEIVTETWDHVKRRDWQANPSTGVV